MLLDLLTLQQQKIRARRRADCDHETPRDFSVSDTATSDTERDFDDLKTARASGYRIIDIREPGEIATEPLPVVDQIIAMNELLADSSVLEADKKYLLVCARGARSAAATAQIRAQGLGNIYSLSGGLRRLKRAPQSA